MIITCPHCNNQFNVVKGLLKEYTYKINGVYFCSYKCWRANGGGKGASTKNVIQESR